MRSAVTVGAVVCPRAVAWARSRFASEVRGVV